MHGHNRRRPILERFAERLEPEPNSGCHLWIGSLMKDTGYGSFTFVDPNTGKSRTMSAHRFAWQAAHGPLPRGRFVCHHCDMRRCANLTHLFTGTSKDNTADMVAKGRQGAHVKMDATTVRAIREFYASGEWTQQALADHFELNYVTVSLLIRGKTWSHIKGADSRRHQATLTEDQVRAIRLRWSLKIATRAQLARIYKVTPMTIWRVVTGCGWRRVY